MEGRDRQHRAQVLFVCECVLFPTALMKHYQSAWPQHAPGHKTVLPLWVPHGRYVAQETAGVHVVSEKGRLRPIKSHCSGNNRRTSPVKQVGRAYLMDVSRGGLAVLSDVSKILWEEDTHIRLRLKKIPVSAKRSSEELRSPDVVVEARSKNSVSCARGEVCTGYT